MNDGSARNEADSSELAAHRMVIERSAQVVRDVAETCSTLMIAAPTDVEVAQQIDQLGPVLAGVGDSIADGLADLAIAIRSLGTDVSA